jgi:hypothetical protein
MKRLITVLIILIIDIKIVIAQKPQPGEYIINNDIDKFVGTWQWVSGNDTVVVKLKKVKFLMPQILYHDDIIMGCHKYVKNGVVIEDFLWKFNSIGQNTRGTIFGGGDYYDINKVETTFRDSAKHKMSKIDMKYINTPIPQISWLLYNYTSIIKPPVLPGNTLPSHLILTKQ